MTKPPPPDQNVRDQALDLEHDVFLAAGAGTGKTTVLVGRYMAALEAGVSPHEIVAVTFTVKAAAEMRGRLREECQKRIAAGDPAQARHWRQITTEVETSPITTIHSFCGSLLRDFAIEAGLDPHYVVMEERPTWLLRRRIVKETLLGRLAEGEESCVIVVSEYGRRYAEELLHGILAAREHYVTWLDDPPTREQVLEYWDEIRPELIEESLAEVLASSDLHEALEILEQTPPTDEKARYADKRQIVLTALSSAIGDSSLNAGSRLDTLMQARAAVDGSRTAKKWDGWASEEQFELIKAALNAVEEALAPLCKALEMLDETAATQAAAANTAALWEEAAACSQAFQTAKAEQSALDFTDLQLEAVRLLADNPDVGSRCRQRYKQVMVDEFQDTNRLQWQIVSAITGFDSQNPDRQGPRLFLVGDAKQSIYGFRNADVTVFRRARGDFAAGCDGVDELVLQAGFRSTEDLVGFHNWLFEHEAVMGTGEKPDYAARFEPVETQREARDDGLAGEALITNVGGGEDGDAGDDDFNAELRREAEAVNIAKRLKEMLDSGFRVEREDGKSRPIAPGDIALLFRATTNINLYERALRRHDIPFYTVVGRGFWRRLEVSDILNMVRVLDNFNDSVALAGVLRSPMFGFDDNELYRVALAGDSPFAGLCTLGEGNAAPVAPADTVEKARWARAKIEEFRSLSGAVPLSVLLQKIVDETGYSAAMAAQFAGRRMLANIEKLIDISRGFERDGNYTLGEFVSYVQTLSEMEDREGEAPLSKAEGDAVELVTIHQAKGREWPVVAIPDFGRTFRAGSKTLVTSTEYGICARTGQNNTGHSEQCAIGELIRQANRQRELAERRRVLYVAATRARDYLIISSAIDEANPKTYPPDTWLSWLAGVGGWNLDAGECGQLGEDFWEMRVQMAPPSELPPASSGRKSLADRHQAAVLAGQTIGDAPASSELRRQVDAVPIAVADLEAIAVTGLSQYRQCPLSYRLRFIEDMPAVDETWGVGRLEDRASGVIVGSFAHLVLEMVGREGIDALDGAMATAQRSPEVGGRLNSKQAQDVNSWIETYLNTPTYATIVSEAQHLRSELPVLFVVDEVIIEGKIDALAEMPDGSVHVLDYKTGRPPDSDGLSPYEFQIGLYCEAVRQSRGELPASATLVYLSVAEIKRLPVDDLIAEALSEARRLLSNLRGGQFGHRSGTWCANCDYQRLCEYCVAEAGPPR